MLVNVRVKKLLTKEEVRELSEQVSTIQIQMKKKIAQFCASTYTAEQAIFIRKELAKLGLKEFEVINLIDTKPKELVYLHNVIEKVTERLDECQMQDILELFKSGLDG